MQIKLVKTCDACPEQYDLFADDIQIGYFRLRHGHFRVYADVGDDAPLYSANPRGDGIFEYEEREKYLQRGIRACIQEAIVSGVFTEFEDNLFMKSVDYILEEK